ncbi:hypothetical protein ACUW97_001184 [Kocuria rhizophila]
MTGIVSSLMPAGTKLRVALWFLMPVVVATGMVVYGWLYSPQGVAAIRDAIYFQDVSLAAPVWIMIAWIAGGIALAVFGTLRQKRRHLFAVLSEREEASTAAAAAAAAASV